MSTSTPTKREQAIAHVRELLDLHLPIVDEAEWDHIHELWPETKRKVCWWSCDQCWPNSFTGNAAWQPSLGGLIVHLNDDHGMGFSEIADAVDRAGPPEYPRRDDVRYVASHVPRRFRDQMEFSHLEWNDAELCALLGFMIPWIPMRYNPKYTYMCGLKFENTNDYHHSCVAWAPHKDGMHRCCCDFEWKVTPAEAQADLQPRYTSCFKQKERHETS